MSKKAILIGQLSHIERESAKFVNFYFSNTKTTHVHFIGAKLQGHSVYSMNTMVFYILESQDYFTYIKTPPAVFLNGIFFTFACNMFVIYVQYIYIMICDRGRHYVTSRRQRIDTYSKSENLIK